MEIMTYLNNKTAKKGTEIIVVKAWNHHFKNDSLGARSRKTDSYHAEKWTIQSIGKKRMVLVNDIYPNGSKYYSDSKGNFLSRNDVNFFVFDESEINDCVKTIREHDEHKTKEFTIVKAKNLL